MAQIAGLVYNYVQSIHETHSLELRHVQRDLEIQAIMRSHEETTRGAESQAWKQALEGLKNENSGLSNKVATLTSSSAELSTARDAKHTELERRNQKLSDEVEMLKKQKDANAKAVTEKRQVEKELQQLKVQLDTTRNKLTKEEGTRSTLQGTEKELKSEIQKLKAQLKQATSNADRASSDLDKVKRKHESEKKVLETKLESLKTKAKLESPAKGLPFSPIRKSLAAPTPRKTIVAANIPKSTFSTTPFLQRTKTVLGSPSKSVLSPSPKKPQGAERKRSSLIRPLKPEQVTITTKDNKQRSLFDDSDGEDAMTSQGKDAEPDKKKRRKLKASKSAFDEDEDDDRSWFKKRPPTTNGVQELGVISPLKKEKNNGMRSIFKV